MSKVIMELAHSTQCLFYAIFLSSNRFQCLNLALSFSATYINPIPYEISINFIFEHLLLFVTALYNAHTKQYRRHKNDQSATVACYIDKEQRCSSTSSTISKQNGGVRKRKKCAHATFYPTAFLIYHNKSPRMHEAEKNNNNNNILQK